MKPIMNSTFAQTELPKEEQQNEETVDLRTKEEHKRLNIHTFCAHDNETCLAGTDENGEELCIWFDSYEFLRWIDKEQLEYIKQQLTKYIKEK